jgi:hypothetical protein
VSFDVNKLSALLPALYRIRDQQLAAPGEDGPLRAMLAVIAEQIAVLEEDLEQLYDDQFIETCAEWVVPYIGDLVGARGLFVFPNATFSQRAQVANTLAYRRRKGTAPVLEQLARDVTGWDASVVEYFQLLATTQYLNHIRKNNLATPHLRDWEPLERISTPFDSVAHTADMRLITGRRGKYNIPNVGIFLWRIGSYSLHDAPAFRVDERRFLFNPLGQDTPLYNNPVSEEQITHLAEPVNVPMPLSRRVPDRDKAIYYGADKSLLLKVNDVTVAADDIRVCNLSDQGGDWAHKPKDKFALDPVLGRIALPETTGPNAKVRVTWHYGFSAEMGGGEYSRAATFDATLKPVIKVPSQQPTIQAALNQLATSGGVIEIENNEYYLETPTVLVPAGKKIELRAADKRRPILALSSALTISGGAGSQFVINGLLISGGAVRAPKTSAGQPNQLAQLSLRHCTLAPGASPAIGSVPAQTAAPRLIIEAAKLKAEITHSITGAIRSIDEAQLSISNSIVDALAESASAYAAPDNFSAGAPLTLKNSTIIGRVHTLLMELASNTIFFAALSSTDNLSAPVRATRLQQGCVRFCYVPPGSLLPRRFHCQPESLSDAARLRPVFTSLRYGDAGYGQLDERCAVEIREGADDQAEMGAFHDLYQPQRIGNLRARLDEYLRFGLEAGIFLAS